MSLKDTPTPTLKELVRLNTDQDGSASCRAVGRVSCNGVDCLECPMFSQKANLAQVRQELDRRKPTESHKGGGAGIYMVGKPEPVEFIPSDPKSSIDEAVYKPSHYDVIEGLEAIEIIARSMTVEQFKGYCLGNIIKYRMRLGAKDAVEQDLKKAQNYKDIFEKHKGLCHDYSK